MRSDTPLLHGEITSSIIDSFEVHGELGYGKVIIENKAREPLFENWFKHRNT